MSPEQIQLVRDSFARIASVSDQVGIVFYDRLFERDPAIGKLFVSTDMNEQARKLLAMIGDAVRLLDYPERLNPVLRTLGMRHADYGVVAEHYDSVGTALLDALAEALGDSFTPAIRDAWTTMYALVANTMRMGAMN